MLALSSALFPIVIFSITQSPGDTSPEILRASSLAKELGQATTSSDFAKIINFTPPEVVKAMGGKEAALSSVKNGLRELKDSGFTFLDYQVQAVGQVIRKGDKIFAVIPTKLTMQTPKGKMEQETYLLAISENRGFTWVFADGAGFKDPSLKAALFPNLPPELILPTAKPPKLFP